MEIVKRISIVAIPAALVLGLFGLAPLASAARLLCERW